MVMRRIKLKNLSYKGFRGQTQELTFASDKTVISGMNGSGKSTVHNAFLWLLTGYDNANRANYNLFDESGKCEVTALFDIDGKELKLMRKGSQTWSKKRDTGEIYRNGDDYEFYIDDLKVSSTKYGTMIRETFGRIDDIKLMLLPDMYRLLDTKTLRKYFADMAGEITPSDFKGDYSSVIGLINKSGIDSAKKVFTNRLAELDKTSKNLKLKIEVSKDLLPNISSIKDIESKISNLEDERKEIEAKRKEISCTNQEVVLKRKEQEDAIFAKKQEMADASYRHDSENKKRLSELESAIIEAKQSNKTYLQRKKDIEELISYYESDIKSCEYNREKLLKEYKELQGKIFEGICPECGSEYKKGSVSYDKALSKFTKKKNEDIERVVKEGKKLVVQLEANKEKIAQLKSELGSIKKIDIKPLEDALYDFKKTMRPFDPTSFEKEISEMQAKLVVIPENEELNALQIKLGDINTEISSLNRELGVRDTYERGIKNIEQMQCELKTIEADIETNTRMKTLIESYQREYADIVRERVNVKFDKVVVEMTRPNKSGGLDDVCNLSLDGVANTNNSASEIIIGCEVCEAFQQHYGLSMPLFIDKAESINEWNMPKHNGQTIILTVSDKEFNVDSHDN